MSLNRARKLRKIEKWTDLIKEFNIDISKPLNLVTADQIRTKREPRLMIKMDTLESLPQIFRENSLFLLPLSTREYVIVKGKGYHSLDSIDSKTIAYDTDKLFQISSNGVESESKYLTYAFNCGLISELCGSKDIISTSIRQRRTPTFAFKINDSEIKVAGAQIEVDGCFEDADQIILFEAKRGVPSSFNIRQVYYPYRTYYGKKKRVRNFFFCFEPTTKSYLFWEYDFKPYDDFESIKLVQFKRYQIRVTKPISIKEYQKVTADETKIKIPQADDVNKIIELPLRIFEGYDTADKIKEAFDFSYRQSNYYGDAAIILGLVRRERNKFKLTDMGEEFLKLSPQLKSSHICKLLLEFKIMNKVFLEISVDKNRVVSRSDIEKLLREYSPLNDTTIGRRASTIVSWFKWIRNNVGIVEVYFDGSIRLPLDYDLNLSSKEKDNRYSAILKLINQGENEKLEFKSSLRWDYKQNAKNKAIEIAASKSIAAFLNFGGGTLIIGVADDKQIIGLEKDFLTLRKQNEDGFELQLTEIINTYIGKELRPHIHVYFENFSGKTVCIVNVEASRKPVYLTYDDRIEFYVRAGNSSQPLNVKEAIEYITNHWK